MPFASIVGPLPAATLWASSAAVGIQRAARLPPSQDRIFAVTNGLFLSAVVGHFTAWPWQPNRWRAPWLSQCEGLEGPVIVPYKIILYASGLTALGGLLLENRRGRLVGLVLPVVAVPAVVAAQRWEFGRLLAQARRRPRWWNRRLARMG